VKKKAAGDARRAMMFKGGVRESQTLRNGQESAQHAKKQSMGTRD